MRAYLQTHNDSRYGTYLNFALVENEIKDPSFEWEETDEEFSYQGEKYDVVSLKVSKDSIRICALKDDRENELDKQMAVIRHTTNDKGSDPVLSLVKFFSAFDITNSNIVFSPVTLINDFPVTPVHEHLYAGTEIHSPPPRC